MHSVLLWGAVGGGVVCFVVVGVVGKMVVGGEVQCTWDLGCYLAWLAGYYYHISMSGWVCVVVWTNCVVVISASFILAVMYVCGCGGLAQRGT